MDRSPVEIERALRAGEGPAVEFKRVPPSDARLARTLCAFANTRGGLLLVGVADSGQPLGLERPDEVARHLEHLARTRLEPALELVAEVVAVGGVRIVAVEVQASDRRPHAALGDDGEGAIMVRVGAATRRAEGEALRALRLERRSERDLASDERRVLEWLRRQRVDPSRPAGDATARTCAARLNLGSERARRALVRLELAGLATGHGSGAARVYVAAP
jgi:hypothetical protein